MIDTADVLHLLSDLVRKIETFDPNTAFRLRLLHDAIKSGDIADMDAWASSNVYQMIDPDSVIARFNNYLTAAQDTDTASESVLQLLKPIRNILWFLPLVITGYAFSQAAAQYANLLSAQPDTLNQPFLYLWQQGFNGTLPGWLTLGGVIVVDVVLLIIIFLLTLTMYALSQIRKSRQEQQAQAREQEVQTLRTELGQALAGAALYLARYQHPIRPGENLERVARRLDATARKMEEWFERIAGQFDGMTRNVTSQFEGMTQNISNSFAGMSQSVTSKFEGTSQNVTSRFEGMTRDISGKFDGMTQQVTKNFADMTQTVTGNFEGMTQNITQDMKDITSTVTKNLEGITQDVEKNFSATTQNIGVDVDNMVKDLTTKYESISQQMTQHFTTLTDQMAEQVLEGRKYLSELGNMTGGVVQTAEHIQQAATALKASNGELSLSMGNLRGPIGDLTQKQEALIETATQSLTLLQQTASTMADLSKKQDRWGTDLRNILDTLDLTIERATELMISLGDFTAKQDAFLDQVQQERREQTALVTLISNATGKSPEDLDDTKN